MKKGLIFIIMILLVVGGVFALTYNGLVEKRENVDTKLADIKTSLQRRADLIPNLVSTVKGFTTHETEVLDAITSARAKIVNASTAAEMSQANDEMSRALTSLNVIVENYPDLKSSTLYINLMDELAGTENRIAIARTNYNDVVKVYNTTVKKFPTNLIASIFNFEETAYFEASENVDDVPNVNF